LQVSSSAVLKLNSIAYFCFAHLHAKQDKTSQAVKTTSHINKGKGGRLSGTEFCTLHQREKKKINGD
jgi:hypothetical protein